MRRGTPISKSAGILLWVYGVGLAGMLLPLSRELFIAITPLNLIFATLFLFYRRWPARRVIITGLVLFIASFLVEAVGVNTGMIFGSYSYGSALGPRLWNTPVIIGLNWFVLIYCTNVISRQLWDLMQGKFTGCRTAADQAGSAVTPQAAPVTDSYENREAPPDAGSAARNISVWKSVFITVTGSLLMVFYDLFLEPAAMRLDMWSWEGNSIPFGNYAAWFFFSVLFHILVRITGEEKINDRALPLLAVQVGFFALIDLFYLLSECF